MLLNPRKTKSQRSVIEIANGSNPLESEINHRFSQLFGQSVPRMDRSDIALLSQTRAPHSTCHCLDFQTNAEKKSFIPKKIPELPNLCIPPHRFYVTHEPLF